MKRTFTNIFLVNLTILCIVLMLIKTAHAQTTKTVASSGADFTTLKDAFDAINSGTLTGSIALSITGNTSETATATLNESGSGSCSYTDITIQPGGGAQRTISGTIAGALINFNGADNVTIDGLNSGGSSLIIQNTSTSNAASTISFNADATYNTVKKCTVLGSTTPTLSGSDLSQSTSTRAVIYFGASASSVGNSYNIIQTCHIGPYSTSLPWSLIYSYGNASYPNQNTISENIMYDFHYSYSGTSLNNRIAAIFLSSNNNAWTLTGNRIYQSASRTQSTYGNRTAVILVQSGQGHSISGNTIGGSASDNSGTMTYTGSAWSFYAIETTGLGADNKTTISGNILKNLSFTTNVDQNYANTTRPRFTAILVEAGYYDITGNRFGSGDVDASTSPSISITASGSTYSNYIGFIWENNTGVKIDNISENQMGGLKVSCNNLGNKNSPSTFSTAIYTYSDYVKNIDNNTIGSLTVANNIYYTGVSPSNAYGFRGIYTYTSASGSPALSISGNTIANITMYVTGTLNSGIGNMAAIAYSSNSPATVNNNTISGLSTNFGTYTSNGFNGEIYGILFSNSNNTVCSGNNIRLLNSLINTVHGITVSGYTTETYLTISGNFISQLSAGYYIYGINSTWATAGGNTINNNIISIHRDVSQVTYGISNNNSVNLYYNSIYLSGTATGTNATSCIILWNYDNTKPVILKNNILYNGRTRTSGSANNICLWLRVSTDGVTLDHNNYYAPNTGGAVGGIGFSTFYTTLSDFKSATSQDANSVNSDPSFATAGGTYASDYLPENLQTGVAITGITTDYYGETRTQPYMGAIEIIGPIWDGSASTNWNTSANWATNVVPGTGANANIPGSLVNYPVIGSGAQATCNNLNVMTGATLTINSGGSLITEGAISNNGTITISTSVTNEAWHFISMPVTQGSASIFMGDYLQYWNESTTSWNDITEPDYSITPVKGYSLWGTTKSDQLYTFTGTPNTGDKSLAITHSGSGENAGFNLMGNPYPSYLDWDEVTGYGSKYTWDGTAYLTYTQTGGYGLGSKYVAPMEGFFIYTANAGTFSLTNAMRTNSSSKRAVGSKSFEKGIVLTAFNGSYEDALWIVFDNEASDNFELERDAWKLISSTEGLSQIWSFCNDGKMAVDVRPEYETFQLGFSNNQAGFNSIGAAEIAGINTAVIEDTKTNTFHDLSKSAYEFTWDPLTDDEKRFKLHLNAVGIEETPINESNLLIYAANGQIFVKNVNDIETDGRPSIQYVTVSDVMGRVVLQKEISGNGIISVPVNLQTGVYLVSVQNGQKIKTEKVIIK